MPSAEHSLILAPLRGVTIRCFRETFADLLDEVGFTEAVTPFISAMPGLDPLADRELRGAANSSRLKVTPQFIGKDPGALRNCLLRVRDAGFDTADLNCGCPFPMVRNKGRGSGLLRTPDVLRRMLEAGCGAMGPGRFSVKARIGIDRPDELLALIPMLNCFPLRHITVHARTAVQMYDGMCDRAAFEAVRRESAVPVIENGDLPLPAPGAAMEAPAMIGRAFIRVIGGRDDSCELLGRYIAASRQELHGDRPVLGRMKELVAYWRDIPFWRRRWDVVKMCRTVDELMSVISRA